MISRNYLKEKIKENKPVIGTWNVMGSTYVTEVLARAGLDYLIIDCEHGAFDLSGINDFVNAAEINMCTPIVRIPADRDWMVLQTLDQGAHGVMVPHMETGEAVRRFVETAKYYPEGSRGFTPFSKGGLFTNIGSAGYTEHANSTTITSIIIESLAGIQNIDEILEINGLDIVYLGAYDLSQALGVPGEVKNIKVINTIKELVKKITGAGKYPGAFVAKNTDDIKWALDMGIKFIPYQVDCSILFDDVSRITDWFRSETK